MNETLDVESVVLSQSWGCYLKYPGLVDQTDLTQEGWLWVLEHDEEVQKFCGEENVKLAAFRLGQRVGQAMDRYARKEKAAKGGYDPKDESFYGPTVISAVLPYVLTGSMTPPQGSDEKTARVNDPAEGGTWMATYLDVKHAWDKADLSADQRDLLIAYFRDDMSQAEIAETLGIQQQAVAKRLKRAKLALVDKLGGPDPGEYEEEDKRLRRRPGQ